MQATASNPADRELVKQARQKEREDAQRLVDIGMGSKNQSRGSA